MIQLLGEMDKEAEERFQEREDKRMKMFLDAEEVRRKSHAEEKKRRANEQQHEERMQYMFMSFMQQSMAMLGGQGYPPPTPYPHAVYPTPCLLPSANPSVEPTSQTHSPIYW